MRYLNLNIRTCKKEFIIFPTNGIENVNSVYGSDAVTGSHFDVKEAPRSRRPIVEYINKIIEMFQFEGHVSTKNRLEPFK